MDTGGELLTNPFAQFGVLGSIIFALSWVVKLLYTALITEKEARLQDAKSWGDMAVKLMEADLKRSASQEELAAAHKKLADTQNELVNAIRPLVKAGGRR